MKLGVITDGISQDFEHALDVLDNAGLAQAEIQYAWDREVGDHSDEQIERIRTLIADHHLTVSCISRHNFAGLPVQETEPDSPIFLEHVDGLRRCIRMAKALDVPMVRTMSGRKEMIIFGSNGAQDWIVSGGAWDRLLRLMEVPVAIAEEEGVTLVVETGNNSMITSGGLAAKLIEDMGSSRLKVLWDVPNTISTARTSPTQTLTNRFANTSVISTSRTPSPTSRAPPWSSDRSVRAMWLPICPTSPTH